MRIDVDGSLPFAVPPDNPFVAQAGSRPEIRAYGLRNPWRFSFDRITGELYAADVGQDLWEKVDLIGKGGNCDWNIMKGTHGFPPSLGSCNTSGLILPIAEYGRSEGSSVTGGYVYRVSRSSIFHGDYVFGVFGVFGSGMVTVQSDRPPAGLTLRTS